MTFYVECKCTTTRHNIKIQANVIVNEEMDTKQKTTR